MGQQQENSKKTVVFGASESGRKALIRLYCFGVHVEAFIDNDTKKWGSQIDNIVVMPPEDIFQEKQQYIVIISSVYEKEIMEQCIQAGMLENQIYILEDYIIRMTENFVYRYQYLKYAGLKPGKEKSL